MSDEDIVHTSMSVPLDSHGFLRRACPTCEREFKWLPSEANANETEAATPDPSGYYCPYCAVQANDGWLTEAQAEVARATVMTNIVDGKLDEFARDLQRSTSGMFQMNANRQRSPEPPELTESDDMRRIDFPCHPSEPLKVLDDWTHPVHCLICGTAALN